MGNDILFKYIAKKIISVLAFFTLLCLVFSELIGISFEQIRLISNHEISFHTSFLVHIFAIPKFLHMVLPYALFMANIFAYQNLAKTREILALKSFGVSISKILMPALTIGILFAIVIFGFQETVVTEFNYKTATTLEKAVNIKRDIIANDFIYSQFSGDQKREMNLFLYAKRAATETMDDLTILSLEHGNLRGIMIAKNAHWIAGGRRWELHEVVKASIDKNGTTSRSEIKSYQLQTEDALEYTLNQSRDDNELNILELKKKLYSFKKTGYERETLQLEKNMQDRFVDPFLCIVFSLVGASIGIGSRIEPKENTFGIGLVAILTYFIFQFIDAALIGNRTLPVWCVWMPSLFGIVFALSRSKKYQQ
jgi:lipopolysaccharide export system permease protein